MKLNKTISCLVMVLLLLLTIFFPFSYAKKDIKDRSNISLSSKKTFILLKNNPLSILNNIEIGDLLFLDVRPVLPKVFPPLDNHLLAGESNDHVAMYIGNGNFVEANYYGIKN